MPKVKVSEIRVEKERFREDFGAIEELAVSIQRYGLFHPIIVDRENNLIAGERRYKAHCVLNLDEIEVRYVEDADELVKREIEIEENLRRKDFTWQEEVKAKREIDKIKRELYGSAIKGHGGGWSLRDTSNSLGESIGLTSRDIRIAQAIEDNPDLKKCKSKEEAWRRIQKNKEKDLVGELATRVEINMNTKCLHRGDSAVEMGKLDTGSVDLICTDPPYGIELQMKADGNYKSSRPDYQDDVAHVLNTIDKVMGECYRVLKEDRHMYLFFDPRHYQSIISIVEKVGFRYCETPLIWYKTGGSGPAGGDMVWARNYECILFCYKGHRALVKGGESDVLTVPRVAPQYKIHPTEKPTHLLRYLILQSTLPGELVCDPFAGSCSTLVAAWETKREGWGCELSEEYYTKGVVRLEQVGRGQVAKDDGGENV